MPVPSRRTTRHTFACGFSPTTPYTTCTPACSSVLAHVMFACSSNRAWSSTSATTCFPASAARISARTMGVSAEVRYSVCLIASTSASREASSTKASTDDAGHAEHVVGHDLHPREQTIEMVSDHLFDRYEPLAVGEWEEPREQRWHLEPREAADPRDGVAHQHGEVEREVRDVGERVRRVDRERREHREDALGERVGGPGPVLIGEVRGVHQADPFLLEGRPDLVGEQTVDPGRGRKDPNADLGELLLGTHPVRGRGGDPGLHLIEQPGDADLEELIQALRADRDELQPLKDRTPRIFGERQDPVVEVQPRKLAVEVMVGRILGGCTKRINLDISYA